MLSYATNKVIALHHCRGGTSCSHSGSDPNRGVPIDLILAQVGPIIETPVIPTTLAPTMAPTPAPTISCSAHERKFTLIFVSDRYGNEVTWNVVNDCTGVMVLENGPYLSGIVGRYVEEHCIPHGESYTFTIFDSYGGE